MRTYKKNRRRTQLRVESLEGKTLLSMGSVMHHVAPQMAVAPIVAQAASFSGSLTGIYSNVDAPGVAHILSYTTSGTLSGVGSTRLRGTLFIRGGARAGRLVGQFAMRNNGGSMIVNISESAMLGDYTYKVVRARGADIAFKGGRGVLMITQQPTFSAPFYVSGQATMTFTPG
jgi:hypothetical protein